MLCRGGEGGGALLPTGMLPCEPGTLGAVGGQLFLYGAVFMDPGIEIFVPVANIMGRIDSVGHRTSLKAKRLYSAGDSIVWRRRVLRRGVGSIIYQAVSRR